MSLNKSQDIYFSENNIFCNLLQSYKRSLHSDSNSSSSVLYSDVWSTHQEQLNKFDDYVMNTCVKLRDNNPTKNFNDWKSSLNHFTDPLTLFEQMVPQCINCKQYSSDIENSLRQFNDNDCKCELEMSIRTTANSMKNVAETNSKSLFVKTLDNGNSQDSFSSEETKHIFKPKFGRQKVVKSTNHIGPFDTSSDLDIDKVEEENKAHNSNVAKITFKTAKETFLASNPAAKRTLGASRKAQGKFVSPMVGCSREKQDIVEPQIVDEKLKHLDPKMIELIESEIIDRGAPIEWEDIAGLQMAKSVIQEAVVWPLLRPDIFTGLRRPPKGILLFGPPGTGKTLIGKCIAAQCNATFFSISASSLTSKWIGDGEKMVRALFAVARCHQPAVIFIDEIDSLLTQRNDSEHEATRRIKTEFLVQFDGAATGEEDRLLIVGATNRPQELDEAARRRLVKRLYIPLPETQAREQIITNLLKTENSDVSSQEIARIAALADGFSGADMKSLCSEAAMGPIRSVPLSQIVSIDRNKVRPVCVQDFLNALQRVRPSVSQDDLGQYVKWNKTYGQGF